MTTTTDISVQGSPGDGEARCPSWCTHMHRVDGTFRLHLSPGCPAWCSGHHELDELDGAHRSDSVYLEPTLTEDPEGDVLEITVWQMPEDLVPGQPRHRMPAVSIRHSGDYHYLPDLTPAEARTLAAHLVYAAGMAER